MPRTCKTPGCCFKDFHDGAHSFEQNGRSRKCHPTRQRGVTIPIRSKPVFKVRSPPRDPRDPKPFQTNDFQLGLEASREAMKYQSGVRIAMPRSAFSGHWLEAPEMCDGTILGPSHEGRFVAEALFKNESEPTLLTSSSLMLCDTKMRWRSPDIDAVTYHTLKVNSNPKHDHAFERAKEMMEEVIRRDIQLGDKFILTLDGMGTNRVAFEEVLESSKQRPTILTLEMQADVALAQRVALGFGDKVLFTGGDSLFSAKNLFGSMSTPTAEHLLLKPNRILSDEIKEKTILLNLDYCGGPPKNHDSKSASFMERVIAQLPYLEMVAFTMARRNHGKLDETFDDYIPPPYGFTLWRTFLDNPRVVCKVYTRNHAVPRTLSIPGYWWAGTTAPAWKNKTFTGVLLGKPRAGVQRVYVPFDDEEYPMRVDAVKAYGC